MKNSVVLKTNKGITLIVLVVTIIILLILAGVTINSMIGEKGIVSKSKDAKLQVELAKIEEEANLMYLEVEIDKYTEEKNMDDLLNKLKQKGYIIEKVEKFENITDIILENNNIVIPVNEARELSITFEGSLEKCLYYAKINGKYYKIVETSNGISIERKPSKIESNNEIILKAEVTYGNSVAIEKINENSIILNGTNIVGPSELTIKYNDVIKKCTVTVLNINSNDSINNNFKTSYGTIDVIWLDGTSNKVSLTPNSPAEALTVNDESLIPVVFDVKTSQWEPIEATDNTWYNYTTGNLERGNDGKLIDNRTSCWANAMTENDSFFVWIPRFAYRITYYESENSIIPTGYYDGYGMWNANNGIIKYLLDDGIETVEYKGNKYIVHPAFMKDIDKTKEDINGNIVKLEDFARGGWDKDLTGFWVAKFEMGMEDGLLESTYGTESKRFQTIGEQYTSARQATYGYNGTKGDDENISFMNSHMMKNSEWGAVAYLAHSQYGRNGNEITINNNGTTFYRGGGSGNAYIDNVNQSTTGNVYGIYDMAGNAYDRVAAFNFIDGSSNLLKKGWTDATNLTVNSDSTKYATKYKNVGEYYGNMIIYSYGKVGDATKEVNSGGIDSLISTKLYYSWFNDNPYLINTRGPFIARGGYYPDEEDAGVHCSNTNSGSSMEYNGFRTVLSK